jgi:hypothetical protein
MRVFDISNPIYPYEVGKAETFRDADGTGVLIDPPSIGSGAWNVGSIIWQDTSSFFLLKSFQLCA